MSQFMFLCEKDCMFVNNDVHITGLVTGPVHVPFQRSKKLITHIPISVLPGTHSHLSKVKQARVKCLAKQH